MIDRFFFCFLFFPQQIFSNFFFIFIEFRLFWFCLNLAKSNLFEIFCLIWSVHSFAEMYQQYVNQAKSAIDYLSSDELKELLNDDEKLEERVNEVVSN